MKRKFVVIVFAFLVGLSAGCATPYQPLDRDGFGYSNYNEFPMNVRFRIEYTANCHTSPATIERYEYQRAQEVCDTQGFANFRLEDEMPIHEQSLYITTKQPPPPNPVQWGSIQYTPVFATYGFCYRRGAMIIECIDKRQ